MLSQNRILIFIVAYNAEQHIYKVLKRIPYDQLRKYDYEILIIDDQSTDKTFEVARQYRQEHPDLNLTTLYNPKNQGYGGNQKLGYHYAEIHKFDIVLLLHGDGQYAPEEFEKLLLPIIDGKAEAVFGSRMMNKKNALKGHMPYYKFVGNIILTSIQNKLLNTTLSEFHSGYRAYNVSAIAKLPINRNSDDFHFDTQIIIQLLMANMRIIEVPISTHYGDEICNVNGFQYALNIIKATIASRVQKLGIFYKREFDINLEERFDNLKVAYPSSQSYCMKILAKNNGPILEIGAKNNYFAQHLSKLGFAIKGVGMLSGSENIKGYTNYTYTNLDEKEFSTECSDYTSILILDYLEHLSQPEKFLDELRERCKSNTPNILITTPNIAFFIIRLQLLFGNFNYSKRGILDLTHKRLFTIYSLKTILKQCGFSIISIKGIPAPFPALFGHGIISKILSSLQQVLIYFSKSLFSYQLLAEVRPIPTVQSLLKITYNHTVNEKYS